MSYGWANRFEFRAQTCSGNATCVYSRKVWKFSTLITFPSSNSCTKTTFQQFLYTLKMLSTLLWQCVTCRDVLFAAKCFNVATFRKFATNRNNSPLFRHRTLRTKTGTLDLSQDTVRLKSQGNMGKAMIEHGNHTWTWKRAKIYETRNWNFKLKPSNYQPTVPSF